MGCFGSKPTPPNPNEIDLTHFELLKVVGKGGFGKVNAITKLDTQELMALKRMEKYAVLQSSSHLKMVWIERKIMSLTSSPFLCNLLYAFESERELFLVMPFMQGGDLRFHLKERGTMAVDVAKFYACELILGLAAMHEKSIVFRDLKPDNILLDAQGHLRISDFGLACILEERNNWQTTGQAGTRGYQAPEVVCDQWYGCEADFFSFGVTVYELLHGVRPWKDWTKLQQAGQALLQQQQQPGGAQAPAASPTAVVAANGADAASPNGHNKEPQPQHAEEKASDRTSGGADSSKSDASLKALRTFHISSKLDSVTADFLQRILCIDKKKRLGCGPGGWEEVKAHPWFKDVDWEKVARKEVQPPITPDLTRANCTADADLADQLLDRKPRDIPPDQQQHFRQWKFRTELHPQPKSGDAALGSSGAASSGAASSSTHATNSSSGSNRVGPASQVKGAAASGVIVQEKQHPAAATLTTAATGSPAL